MGQADAGGPGRDLSRIVVVDDNQPSAQLVKALLARAGMPDVKLISGPPELFARYDELNPQLVLLDLHMPVMDGYEALTELRGRTSSADLPILVLTADATLQATHRALRLGASDFLTKPIDATELILRVRNLLSARALHEESQLQQRWLEASAEIGAELLAPAVEDPLHRIARRAIDIADADFATVAEISPDRTELLVRVAVGHRADELRGLRFRLSDSRAGQVADSGRPMLLDPASGEGAPSTRPGPAIWSGPLMVLPLRGTGTTRGILSIGRIEGRGGFSPTDLRMAAGFASHASIALELADSRAGERKRLLLEERDRIAIDLHEHVIQELFAIGLSLVGIAARVRNDEQLAARVRQCVDDTDRTIQRIRSSIFGLRSAAGPPRPGPRADGPGPI